MANLASALLLVTLSGSLTKWKWPFFSLWGYFLFVNLLLFLPYGSQAIEKKSLSGLWPGFEILESRWSPYGNVNRAGAGKDS